MQGGRNEPAVQCAAGVRSLPPPYDAAESEVKYNGERAEQADATPAPYAAGTGSVPALDRDAFARMGYRERLRESSAGAEGKENPEVYKE